MATFSFRGFTLRTAERTDAAYQTAMEWTDADPAHRSTQPIFWFEKRMGVESYILEDQQGIVFFFKMMRPALMSKEPRDSVELHIQFPPANPDPKLNAQQRERVIRGLSEGLQWVERALADRDVSTLFFVSKNPSLIRFCEKRLGFVSKDGRLVKYIAPVPSSAGGNQG